MIGPNTQSEDFIRLVEQSRRGRLQLHIETGPAGSQGQGLLREAAYLAKRGLDVVLGYLDGGVLAGSGLAAGLETLPKSHQEYRGLAVEDLDLRAALARRPQVLVVQDLAHLSPPPGPARCRYQDVALLLEAGISILASVEAARLEGLPGTGGSVCGPGVHRQVPASFWQGADQIVVTPPDQEGPEDAGQVLRPGLEALGKTLFPLAPAGAPEPPPGAVAEAPGRRVMVCLPERPAQALELLRGLGELERVGLAKWYAVQVTPGPEGPSSPEMEPVWLQVRTLGGEPVRLKGRDPLPVLLDFARAHGVRHILLGRARETAWKNLLGLSLSRRLMSQSQGFDLHVMALEEDGERP